jgi:DNA-binding beta-propeller fold protein YncE
MGIPEPRRILGGHKSRLEYVCGVAIDPVSREIYTVNNDTFDNMVVFSRDQNGDVVPLRELSVDHSAWGLSLDRDHDEVAVTSQQLHKVAIYRRTAQGKEAPVRIIQGNKTGLADPHGVSIDGKNDEIVVANQGSWQHIETGASRNSWAEEKKHSGVKELSQSTGRFDLPSIRVYSRTANGDVAPLRTIQGSKTGLNLPAGVAVDAVNNEIVVANDGGNSVLFFSRTANGNVAPLRSIGGPATGLKNPVGVSIDAKNDEIGVTNWGDHSANFYRRTARGNVKPLRSIRGAPPNQPLAGFGNPGALAYDPNREQVLVPN